MYRKTDRLLIAAAFAFLVGLALLLTGCGSSGGTARSSIPSPTKPPTSTPLPSPTPSPTPPPPPISITLVHSNDTWGYTLPCG